MSCTIVREMSFEAAHRLPLVPEGHRCRRLHGHNFRCEVHVTGAIDPETGWVVDFGDVADAFEPIRAQLDHHYLNEIEGLENPTSENLARWIWDRLCPVLQGLSAIVLHENEVSRCIYRGEG
jgi:6-pyruvoyltetrahydropterin/6-carboxytetrahydropterin synthase